MIEQQNIPVKEPTKWITAGSISTVYPPFYTSKKEKTDADRRKKG